MSNSIRMEMSHDKDPAEALISEIGDITQISLFPTQLLIATYVRPEKTKAGLYVTPKYRDEDLYQGKVGLLLKKGANAFKSDDRTDFGGFAPEIGQWVVSRSMDGTALSLNGMHCRIIEDTSIKATVPHPDMVM